MEKVSEMKDNEQKDQHIWLVANDSCINGIIEPGGENCRYIFHMDTNTDTNIDFNTKPYSDILANDLVANVIKGGKLGTYRHLKLPKDCDKVVSNEYFLIANDVSYDLNNNKLTQLPVHIYSSGLTFHDVMVATGRIPSGSQLLFTDCLIGCEFAGRRVDTGQRVMGFEMSRCFATSINAAEHLMTHIPEHWSMDEAVSVLSTHSTAWYALIERANLKKNESILIHSGAGGVGQSAIIICQYYNCDIYVTVGTEEKKQFLMNEYNIPEKKIFSSRDVTFKYKIKELTDGRGVDIVLNSLAGDLLEASYACVANRGRFLELGKYDLIQNKKLGMFDFLRDVAFIGVAVDICFVETTDFAINFFEWMHRNSGTGCVRPINTTVFRATEAEKAFRYMTTGKHIGKIVIKIRDEECDRNRLPNDLKPAINLLTTYKTYFNPNKMYVITGGLGGFGLELVHWMSYMGAKKFALTSRTGITTDYQKFIINRLLEFGEQYKVFGIKIMISTADCQTLEGATQLIEETAAFGPIGGIFHLALVLNDCLIENQTEDKFCESIDTKHKIFANLDQLSRQLDYKLDYFVVFSSITCGKGNAGQSNYAFGNSMCERICEERRRDGLHGLAVQYGPVGDVGVFADSDQQMLSFTTIQTQRINSCCDVLDKLLAIKQPIVTSYVRAKHSKQSGTKSKRIVKELWRALGIDPDTTPEHLTLGEIGIESMFAVELQQELYREYNVKLSINHIKSITVKMLKDYERGSEEQIRKHLDEVKAARQSLLRYKFVIPNETHVRLNAVRNGRRAVYLMPTLQADFTLFETIAKKLDRPVIGLNWTRDVSQLSTTKEVCKYYVELMGRLEPSGGYDVLGYLDGALVCTKLLRKGLADKAVIVDVMSGLSVADEPLNDENISDLMLLFIGRELPSAVRDRLVREVKAEPDLNAKIKRISDEIKDFAGKGLIATDLEELLHIMVKRIQMLSDYRVSKRRKLTDVWKMKLGKKFAMLTGRLIMIKPFENKSMDELRELVDKTRDIYLLPSSQETNENITVDCVNTTDCLSITSVAIEEKILEVLGN
ncbi:unnamed protein product [Medioppia subpectinata]|uniref:Carrier domain-containing protein n=1 Tax=Medioppia subpectinata TaxID=1979941 RepID=A0A7R9KVP6_9ACAR|nr:unnamed protein product [Medioppia subpectinata]CAG2109550.1 unnamed protein product [Medioppia subpectinata]